MADLVSTTSTIAPPALRTGTWEVEALSRQPGLTRVTRSRPEVQLRIGDLRPADHEGYAGPALRSLLSVRLREDGQALVVAHCAPPALVLTTDDVRLLPAGGAASDTFVLEPGDLLLLHSAAVLETDPRGVVDLLQSGPASIRDLPVAQLVRTMLGHSESGAAAVARFVSLAGPA